MSKPAITIYHSPDADDAFMFYGLTNGDVSHPKYDFQHDMCDIESLNKRTIQGEIDCTAVSVHAFAYLQDQYVMLTCGASMGGKDYGPRVVMKESVDFLTHPPKRIACPGQFTSATLALKIFLKEHDLSDVELVQTDFDQVEQKVLSGETDAGLVIHEGQITHEKMGVTSVLDLGKWWWDETEKPLPLGVNVVRKSLGEDAIFATARVLYDSIDYSLKHRTEALEYALSYGRGISEEEADVFVGMYVNDLSLDIGESGAESIREFLGKGVEYGFLPDAVEIEFASPQ